MKNYFFLLAFATLTVSFPASAQDGRGAGGFDCKGDPQCVLKPAGVGGFVLTDGKLVDGGGNQQKCCTSPLAPGDFTDDGGPRGPESTSTATGGSDKVD